MNWFAEAMHEQHDILGRDLGQVAATFLGEGTWRPNRKAIAECWEAARQKKQAG